MENTRCRSRGPLSDERRVGKHHRKQQTPSVKRRNERERNRVKSVNSGFNLLQKHIPGLAMTPSKKLSKVDTLRSAVDYIRFLHSLIEDADKVDTRHEGTTGASVSQEVNSDTETRVPAVYQPAHHFATSSPTPSYSEISMPFQIESYPGQESDPGYSSSSYLSSSPSHPQPCSPGQCQGMSPIHYLTSPMNYPSAGQYQSPPAQYQSPPQVAYPTMSYDASASTGLDSLHDDDLAMLSAWIQ